MTKPIKPYQNVMTKSVGLHLPKDLYDKLVKYSTQQERSTAQTARIIIRDFLKNKKVS